jgi:hypothetical protein
MSSTVEEKHAHLLTKTNIQMCRDCHRFFIITYEKNERGEAVETSYELDIHATLSGIVRPESPEWERQTPENYRRKRDNNHKELTCF